MFFRRRQNKKSKDTLSQPILGKDGQLYVEEGQEYDSDQYETDSDYESSEEEGLEYEEEEVSSDDDSAGDDDDEDHDNDHENDHDENVDECKEVKIKNKENEEEKSLEDGIGPTIRNSAEHVVESVESEEQKENEMIVRNVEEIIMHDNVETKGNEDVVFIGKELNESIDAEKCENENVKEHRNEEITLNGEIGRQSSEEIRLLESVSLGDEANNDSLENKELEVEEGGEDTDEDDEDQQNQTTTLNEKRSLLALAAQHDRVDIIKTILQSTHPDSTNQTNVTQLIQLLLNNKIIISPTASNSSSSPKTEHKNRGTTSFYTKDDIEPVFLPPLHIAIASSATNAASCLLRMGADPSIRPMIPENWDGPVWDEKQKKEDVIRHWRKVDGLSAWEIAFGKTHLNASGLQKHGIKEDEKKRSWFGWSSSNNDASNKDPKEGPSFDIAPSKLEGIKHAFTAEALRAIGSDEVNRLRELLSSGLDSSLSGKPNNTDRGVEIGGKDLLGWCAEMNAQQCIEMLKESYSPSAQNSECDKGKDESMKQEAVIVTEEEKHPIDTSKEISSKASCINEEEAKATLLSLQIKLEENRVLAGSLSLVLDNLAEEVSLTQGLLYQQGDSSNTALISQVRILKESRAENDIEISEWEGRFADRIVELRMVLNWWKRKGGSEDDFSDIFDGGISSGIRSGISSGKAASELPMEMTFMPAEKEPSSESADGHQNLQTRIIEMKAQVTLSESKVQKLRSSIVDLAEENSRNLQQVTKMGLAGAVSLARKLKEEVKEREHILQNLKQREAACRTRVCMIRTQLENLSAKAATSDGEGEAIVNSETDSSTSGVVDSQENQVRGFNDSCSNNNNNKDSKNSSRDINGEENESYGQEEVMYYDEEEDCFIEYVDHSDDSDVEYEYYSDSDDEEIPLSEAVRSGKSTALVVRKEPHVFLSFKIWELLMRVIGLSKKVIKQTAQDHGLDDLGNLPRAMIV